ncbi:sulfotransferase family protein [Salinimicrobium terrae]|uniref:sulfotransferase family protein n=1 Tax=Salinimicrobium terrae TaxID=470866 RepID=UPI00048CF009|nr:sulfotransferase [Salinimicrobium terrae]
MTKSELLHKVTARFKGYPVYSKPLAWTGKEITHHQWIFIIGCYNSGTTLLDQILSAHSKVSGLPDEGVMLTDQLPRPEDFNWRRMWWKCEEEIDNYTFENQPNSRTIKNHWSHFYDLTKPYLVEKSISNIYRLAFFDKEFQPAYFVHIVRNGYAVAEGIQRKVNIMKNNPFFAQKKYPIEYCAMQWVKSLQKVEEKKANLSNFLEIKYEDFTANPKKVVNEIYDFVGLEHVEDDFFKRSFKVHEKENLITNMNVNSFKRLAKEDIRIINKIAGEYLEKYNYKLL